MKKTTITFNDDYMLMRAKREAEEAGQTLSQYICSLVDKDIKAKSGYKLIAYYDNGSSHIEEDFYTDADLAESVRAYDSIFLEREPLMYFKPEDVRMIGYEAWKNGKQFVKKGSTNNA